MSTLNVKVGREGYENRLNKALKLLAHSPDITIEAEDGELEVNWLLLLMYSPTLSSAISEQNSPSFSSILFPDYSIESLRALYDLLVNGFSSSNDLSAQDFGHVLEIAKDLQIHIDNENVEMVESKACTQPVSVVTKSMNYSETKIVSDFKTQDDATLPNDSNSKPNFLSSVQESIYAAENNVKVEVLEEGGEKAVYLVRCKESWGKFHHEKFVSGSKGQCIFFQDKWMTPNDFERLAGSKAKKYKDSLYVNGKPLKTLVDPNGTRIPTPLVKQKQFSNRSKIEGHIQGTPVKCQGSISHYFSPKVKKHEIILDQHYNRDEISPSKADVNVKNDLKGKFRIADIADSKKRKRQSNEPNCTKITESKKMHLDMMSDAHVKPALMISKGENSTKDNDKDDVLFTSDHESCIENPLIIDLNHADNCQPPIVSESNAKQIINNVFQEMIDSIQFENEYILKKASEPVEKRVSTRYSEEQTSGLRNAFDESNYISKEKAQELSKNLCLTENQVRDWFKKSRAKNKAVTYKTVDKLKVKTEIVDKIELHLEEKIDEGKEIKSTDTSVQKIQNEIEGIFEAYTNKENRCTCECGLTFKNATLLKFHKHICPKKSVANVVNSKGESSTLDAEKDDTSNDFHRDGGKNQCTCECGVTFKNAMLLKYHKHICPTGTKEEL